MVKFNLDLNGKTILVTGAAGFIGSNLAKRLINDYKDIKVIGLDTMTDYYDVNIKKERLRGIEALGGNWYSWRNLLQTKRLSIKYSQKIGFQ